MKKDPSVLRGPGAAAVTMISVRRNSSVSSSDAFVWISQPRPRPPGSFGNFIAPYCHGGDASGTDRRPRAILPSLPPFASDAIHRPWLHTGRLRQAACPTSIHRLRDEGADRPYLPDLRSLRTSAAAGPARGGRAAGPSSRTGNTGNCRMPHARRHTNHSTQFSATL